MDDQYDSQWMKGGGDGHRLCIFTNFLLASILDMLTGNSFD